MAPASLNAITDFEALSADYGRYHTHPQNRLCHAFGIPLIMLAVIRWTQVPGTFFPVAALALPLYFVWNPGLSAAMTLIFLAMTAAAALLNPWAVWAAFIAGWILQFVGHAVYEKKSPAFSKNLAHILVGPMWILREFLSPFGAPN